MHGAGAGHTGGAPNARAGHLLTSPFSRAAGAEGVSAPRHRLETTALSYIPLPELRLPGHPFPPCRGHLPPLSSPRAPRFSGILRSPQSWPTRWARPPQPGPRCSQRQARQDARSCLLTPVHPTGRPSPLPGPRCLPLCSGSGDPTGRLECGVASGAHRRLALVWLSKGPCGFCLNI